MPQGVGQRYEAMLKEHPQDRRAKASLENYRRALSHPDEKDLEQVRIWAKAMVDLAK